MKTARASTRCWGIIEKGTETLLDVANCHLEGLKIAQAWRNTHKFVIKEIEWRIWGARNNEASAPGILSILDSACASVLADLSDVERGVFARHMIHAAVTKLTEMTGSDPEEVAEEFRKLMEGGQCGQ